MRTDITKKLDVDFNETALARFLGKDDSEKFKQDVSNIILERIRSDLKDSHYYIICPDDVSEMIETFKKDIIFELKEELGADIKRKLKEDIVASILSDKD